MKEVISDNYSIWIGADSLSKLDVSEYSKVAILVDENTKRDCLNKLSKVDNSIINFFKFVPEWFSIIVNRVIVLR